MNSNSGRIDLVKHKINDHSRDRNIQPDRQSDSRDAPVANKVVTKRPVESKKHKRHYHHSEDGVARQDREVDWTDNARSLETCRAVVVVIREIRS